MCNKANVQYWFLYVHIITYCKSYSKKVFVLVYMLITLIGVNMNLFIIVKSVK